MVEGLGTPVTPAHSAERKTRILTKCDLDIGLSAIDRQCPLRAAKTVHYNASIAT